MRPQRQARSSVSYKDNLSDDDDFSMPVGRSSRKPSSHKKNAAVEEEQRPRQQTSSAPKRKERPNPKERAEAMQLERAIKESLNDADRQGTKVSEPSSSPRPPFRSLHLDEYRSNIHRPSIAFQCLLDVASEEDGSAAQDETVALESHSQQEKDEPQVSSGSLTTSGQVDAPVCANAAPEQSKPTANAANLEKGFHEEVQEKYYEDTSRHKEVRESSGSIENEEQNEEDSSSFEAKASRKARRLVTEDSSPSAGSMSRNRVLEGNVAKDGTSEQQKPVSEESNQRIWLAQHSPSNGVENEARKPGMSPPATESSGLLLSVQSSSLPHRRVVGLSRRFRPPPLHPYLLG